MHDWVPISQNGSEPFPQEAARTDGREAERLLLGDFLTAMEGGAPSTIDMDDALTWCVVAPLSRQSIAAGSRPVDTPAF